MIVWKTQGTSSQKWVFWRIIAFGGAWKDLRVCEPVSALSLSVSWFFLCFTTELIYTFHTCYKICTEIITNGGTAFLWEVIAKKCSFLVSYQSYLLHWSATFLFILLTTSIFVSTEELIPTLLEKENEITVKRTLHKDQRGFMLIFFFFFLYILFFI